MSSHAIGRNLPTIRRAYNYVLRVLGLGFRVPRTPTGITGLLSHHYSILSQKGTTSEAFTTICLRTTQKENTYDVCSFFGAGS